MRFLAALLLVTVSAGLVYAADDTRPVKIYTLKDGTTIVAVRTMAVTADGKTTYDVTKTDGKKVTFGGDQVKEIAEDVIAVKNRSEVNSDNAQAARIYADFLKQNNLVQPNDPFAAPMPAVEGQPVPPQTIAGAAELPRPSRVEPYTGPNLGLQPDVTEHHHHHSGWYPLGDGVYWGSYNYATYILDRTGLHRLGCGENVYSGPVIGMRNGAADAWQANQNWNASLAAGGSTYYPNTPAGYAASIAGGYNATLAQGGGTYISNNPRLGTTSRFPGYNNWPYTGNYFDDQYAKSANPNATPGFNPYAPAMKGSNFRPNNSVLSPIGSVTINNTANIGTRSNSGCATTGSASASGYRPPPVGGGATPDNRVSVAAPTVPARVAAAVNPGANTPRTPRVYSPPTKVESNPPMLPSTPNRSSFVPTQPRAGGGTGAGAAAPANGGKVGAERR